MQSFYIFVYNFKCVRVYQKSGNLINQKKTTKIELLKNNTKKNFNSIYQNQNTEYPHFLSLQKTFQHDWLFTASYYTIVQYK